MTPEKYQIRIEYIYEMLDGGNAATFEAKERSVLDIMQETGRNLGQLTEDADEIANIPCCYNSECL